MELKVIIDNTSRLVCGLNEETTVHDVIVALANSLGQTGRFYLIEKVATKASMHPIRHSSPHHKKASFKASRIGSDANPRMSEPRIMAPYEKPMEILSLQNKLLARNEFIEFHLFKSKYLALDNDNFSEKMIENELIEKLNTLIDRPSRDTSISEHYSRPIKKKYQEKKYLKNKQIICEPPQCLYTDDPLLLGNYQSCSSTSRSSLNSPSAHCSNSTITSNDSNYFSSERITSQEEDGEEDEEILNNKSVNSLLKNITNQQSILEDQSLEMDELFKEIRNYETTMLHLNQKKECFKVTLNNLELLNCLNATKLSDLERETNEITLLKEMEFNDFLCAQRDYYERRLNELSNKSESEVVQVESLSSILKQLNNLAEAGDIKEVEVEAEAGGENENDSVLAELNKAKKNSELNKARLEYLELSSTNLDKCLEEKHDLINILEEQLAKLEAIDQSISSTKASDSVTEVTDYDDDGETEINTNEHQIEQCEESLEFTDESSQNIQSSNSFDDEMMTSGRDGHYPSRSSGIDTITKQPEISLPSSSTTLSGFSETSDTVSSSQENYGNKSSGLITVNEDDKTEELEETYSMYSIESSSSESSDPNHEAMASFLRYKRIREKSLMERNKTNTNYSSNVMSGSVNPEEKSRDAFNQVFNTVHYF